MLNKNIILNPEKTIRVFYHANCWDGIFAATVAMYHFMLRDGTFDHIDFIAVNYSDVFDDKDFELLKNNYIYILDFSFKRDVMLRLEENAKFFVCLDHHVTAKNNLEGVPNCFFNMEVSGAGLAWLYFSNGYREIELLRAAHPEPNIAAPYYMSYKDTPRIIWYTQDYDIWKFFGGDKTRIFNLARSTWKMELSSDLFKWFDNEAVEKEIENFAAAYEVQLKQIERLVQTAYPVLVPVGEEKIKMMAYASVDPALMSVTATQIYQQTNLPVFIYSPKYFHNDTMVISFRSPNGIDCSKFAEFYGGGGHKGAAGCTMKTELILEIIRERAE